MIETALGFSLFIHLHNSTFVHGVHSLFNASFILSTVYYALKHTDGDVEKQLLSSNHRPCLVVFHTRGKLVLSVN